MGVSEKEFRLYDDTLSCLYEATTSADSLLWRKFAQSVQRWLSVEQSSLVMLDPSEPCYRVTEGTAMSPQDFDHYFETIHDDNVWVSGIEELPAGRPYRSCDLFPNKDLPNTRFYEEYLKDKQYYYAAGGYFHEEGDSKGLITIYQTLDQGSISPDKNRKLHWLFPHLKRAFEINFAFSRGSQVNGSLSSGLSHLGKGLIFLDEKGCVLEMNDVALDLMDRNGFSIIHNKVILPDSPAQQKLQISIKSILSTGNKIPISISWLSKKEGFPFKLTLLKPKEEHASIFDALKCPKALILLNNPWRNNSLSPEMLKAVWNLTFSESRIALCLASGCSLRECADKFFITYETARSHLKNIFMKTEAHSQNELISEVNDLL